MWRICNGELNNTHLVTKLKAIKIVKIGSTHRTNILSISRFLTLSQSLICFLMNKIHLYRTQHSRLFTLFLSIERAVFCLDFYASHLILWFSFGRV